MAVLHSFASVHGMYRVGLLMLVAGLYAGAGQGKGPSVKASVAGQIGRSTAVRHHLNGQIGSIIH